MAYLDIASNSCYGRYNKKFANIVGLNTAVYWSAIMEVLDRVREKKTYDENGFFKLNRKYIEANTSLTYEQQYESDAMLVKLGILEINKDTVDKMRVDIKGFFQILTEEDPEVLSGITKIAISGTKKGKSAGKREGIILRLLETVQSTETDEDIISAYSGLLEVCYEKGLQKVQQIKLFMETLNNYTEYKDVKIKILEIATSLGYRDCTWAINQYEKANNKPGKLKAVQKVSAAIDTDTKF